MKVLLVHNFYQSSSPSGEDMVFSNELELLKKNNIEVIPYIKENDRIKDYGLRDKFFLPFKNLWSRTVYKEIQALIKKEKPDIAHFHNIWYLVSPAAYSACKDAGVPVVQTLHNFRFFCINGLLMRNARVCEECISTDKDYGLRNKDYGIKEREKETNRLWAIGHGLKVIRNVARYGCYRDSRLYSIPLAVTNALHQSLGTLQKKVDCFIALTEFAKNKFVACGLPPEKIVVKPNFLPDPPEAEYSHKGYGIYLGRISAEKGLNILINADNLIRLKLVKNIPVKIVGDGPLKDNLQQVVNTGKIQSIAFTGRRSFAESMNLLQQAQFLVLPSLCYEGFPMAIREAFACGKPVIASRLGGMAELVQDGKTGMLFEPGNPADLAEKLQWVAEHDNACIEMGKNARKVFEERYTSDINFQKVMGIYKKVMKKD